MTISKKILQLSIILITFSLVFHPLIISARNVTEIEAEKIQKQKELEELNAKLKEAEGQLNSVVYKRNTQLSQFENIKAELAEIDKQLEVNQLKKKQLEKEIKIKSLEKEEREGEQNAHIATSYMSWKTQDETQIILRGNDVLKNAIYYDFVTETSENSILGLTNELNQLKKSNEKYEDQLNQLADDSKGLEDKKIALEKQISELNSTVSASASSVTGLRSQVAGAQQQLDFLTQEQQAILNQENQILLKDNAQCQRNELQAGEYYFVTRGRDLYQGHGIGLSQFGAYGAAQKGWSSNKILTFYYSNTAVSTLAPRSVSVQGYGTMDINTYVAGLGEIPDRACGTKQQAESNPSKFVEDNPNTMWDCWPEAAIEAQVVAARTYAATSGQPICTSASCQVYKGGTAKQWAANETKDQYVTYGGNPIRAYYSSDNSQGYGTANVGTVWNNYDGSYSGGTPASYLKHVNDMGVAANGGYRDWTCRTNSYTMAEIDQMFEYTKSNYPYAQSFLSSLKSGVGTVTNLTFEKGPSQRVKVVTVHGTKGSRTMSGMLYKYIWNYWVDKAKPSGQYDYIYSLTWTMNKQ